MALLNESCAVRMITCVSGCSRFDLFEHLQTIGIGKLQIEQDNGWRIASQRSQSVRGVWRLSQIV